MKKFKYLLIIVFLASALTSIKFQVAAKESWEYYPLGDNYLDPTNFVVRYYYPYAEVTGINHIRMKPATTYTLLTSNYKIDYLDTYHLIFYDYNNQMINDDVKFIEHQEEQGVTHISFETPANTYKVFLYFAIFHDEETSPDFSRIDEFTVLCEGEQHPSDVNGNIPYLGPNENMSPVFHGEAGYYITNVDNPISVETIKSSLIAIDDYDGDVTSSIIIYNDNYTTNAHILGTYDITYRAFDSNNNFTDFIIYINIIDNVSPQIDGQLEYTVSPITLLTTEEIINNLVVSDNYDEKLEVSVVNDNYTENYHKIGQYYIDVMTSDSSGNYCFEIITINVVDEVAPIIEGPKTHNKPNNIYISIDDYLSEYHAIDDVDGDITEKIIIIEDNYSAHPNRIGIWTVILSVTDNAGNTSHYTLTIEVVDATGPVFFIDKTKITIDLSDNSMQLADIIDLMRQNNTIRENAIVEVVEDNYTGNHHKAGKYFVKLQSEYDTMEIEIEVLDKTTDIIDDQVDSKIGLFKKIANFFRRIWQAIINIFR